MSVAIISIQNLPLAVLLTVLDGIAMTCSIVVDARFRNESEESWTRITGNTRHRVKTLVVAWSETFEEPSKLLFDVSLHPYQVSLASGFEGEIRPPRITQDEWQSLSRPAKHRLVLETIKQHYGCNRAKLSEIIGVYRGLLSKVMNGTITGKSEPCMGEGFLKKIEKLPLSDKMRALIVEIRR